MAVVVVAAFSSHVKIHQPPFAHRSASFICIDT